MTRTAAEVERDVETTRNSLDRTVEALKDKMTPSQLFDEASQAVGGVSQQLLQRVVQQAKENPIPMAVVGLGLAWMLTSQNRSSGDSPGEARSFAPPNTGRASNAAHSIGGGVSNAAHAIGEKASDMADAAKAGLSDAAESASDITHAAKATLTNAASQATDTVQHYGRSATQGFMAAFEREPLLIGALGLFVGLAVGAALPSTEAEDRLMGPLHDKLVDQGQAIARNGLQQASEVAHATYDAAKSSLEEGGDGAELPQRLADAAAAGVEAAQEKLQPTSGSTGSGAPVAGTPSSGGQSQVN